MLCPSVCPDQRVGTPLSAQSRVQVRNSNPKRSGIPERIPRKERIHSQCAVSFGAGLNRREPLPWAVWHHHEKLFTPLLNRLSLSKRKESLSFGNTRGKMCLKPQGSLFLSIRKKTCRPQTSQVRSLQCDNNAATSRSGDKGQSQTNSLGPAWQDHPTVPFLGGSGQSHWMICQWELCQHHLHQHLPWLGKPPAPSLPAIPAVDEV